MPPPLLQMTAIAYTLGGTPLLDGVDLSVGRGERICLVGRNGSGKSTLMRMAAGMIEPDRGTRFLQPDATLRVLPQEPDLSGFDTVLDYVEAGLGPVDDPYRAKAMLEILGLTGAEHPARLSGGEVRRAALVRVIAPDPDILLLDEPTNHLDLPAIEWLEAELAASRAALVLVSHDRRFLTKLSRATVWLDRGRARRIERGFGAFEDWRDQVLEEEERDRHKLDRKIVAEEDWVRYGVTARRKRNVGRMANLQALRRQRRDERRATGLATMTVSDGRTSGKLVIEAEEISKSFGQRDIVKGFSTRILRGDRVGIVGANGAGKTTLINLLTGRLDPDAGMVRLGSNVALATLDQARASLAPATTLADALTGGGSDQVVVNGASRHVIGYMKDFLFGPEQARTPVSRLSGGERGRLMLARALALPSNLMVLDEPTNDLDLETLDLLEDLINDYPGTVVVVSHDRDFLDRVATSVVVAEGRGRWQDYAGGYTDMVAQRGEGVVARAAGAAPKARSAEGERSEADAASPAKRKLGFKERHALDQLPKRMDELQLLKLRLQAALDDPGLYARDAARFGTLSQNLADVEAKLAALEDEWLELEMLREEVEG